MKRGGNGNRLYSILFSKKVVKLQVQIRAKIYKSFYRPMFSGKQLFSQETTHGFVHLILHFIGGRCRCGLNCGLLNLLAHGLHGVVESATTGWAAKNKIEEVCFVCLTNV